MSDKLYVASIGDCCVDIYPQKNKFFPGGSAFNVALQVHKTGAEASIISAVGTDAFAELFHTVCKTYKINAEHLSVIQGTTSNLKVQIDDRGKPSYTEWDLGVLRDYLPDDKCELFLEKQRAIRFVLFRPLAHIFDRFCQMRLSNTLKIADFAGITMYSEGIETIKRYIHNFDIFVKSLDESDTDALQFFEKIAYEEDKIVLVLLGAKGSIVFSKGKMYQQQAFTTTEVRDTTGAGDAYNASFIVTYLQTRNIEDAMYQGTLAATRTISHFGANPACVVEPLQ